MPQTSHADGMDASAVHLPAVVPGPCPPFLAAGPIGRRSDKVGGFYFIHRDDLKAVSTLWLKYTEDVRADPDVSHCSIGSSSL